MITTDNWQEQREIAVAKEAPYSLSAKEWKGLGKVIEECGELQQAAGRLISTGGETNHWDGGNLWTELADECADAFAAIQFFINNNGFDIDYIYERADEKIKIYKEWSSCGQ
jgi:NTP pyrophosphatase (non-canonical NTP hydrolase)